MYLNQLKTFAYIHTPDMITNISTERFNDPIYGQTTEMPKFFWLFLKISVYSQHFQKLLY